MHYYKFNIADYRKDTAHLSPIEHYIYRWLIDQYYLDETPITPDDHQIGRKLRLNGEEKKLLFSVLNEFFDETSDGWVHNRIADDLDKIYEKSEKAQASANVRWEKHANAMRTHNERNANGILPITHNPEPHNPLKDSPPAAGVVAPTATPTCQYQKIVDSYHKNFPAGARVKLITDKRKKSMKARWSNGHTDMEFWDDYFKHAATSQFLVGNNNRNWVADFDFFIRPDTATFMQEGKYHK